MLRSLEAIWNSCTQYGVRLEVGRELSSTTAAKHYYRPRSAKVTMARLAGRNRVALKSTVLAAYEATSQACTSKLGTLQNDAIALQAIGKKAVSGAPEVEIKLPIISFAEVRDNSFPL